MKKKYFLALTFSLLFITKFSFGQDKVITQNTNLKFYLTDTKKTPVSLTTINFITTNDLPSFKFLKNIGNNDKTDNYGNYSLSEQLIKKSDLQKSWLFIINSNKNLDTVSAIIVFDKDEKIEYYLKKDSLNRFVFDFGRSKITSVSKNKITSALLKLTETETQKPITNQKVIYNNAAGKKQNTTTNNTGIFKVENISKNNFAIELEQNEKLKNIKSVDLLAANGKIISQIIKSAEGTFKYTFLPSDFNALVELENNETNLKIVQSSELKLTETESKKPIANQKILYSDAAGKKQNTTTNNDGFFKVENIIESNFTIELEKNTNLNSISSIRVSNKEGATITEIKKNNQSSFEYTFLPSDFIKLSEISIDETNSNSIKFIELKLTDSETKKPISNQKVMYNDVDGKKQNSSTDEEGVFSAKNISTENLQIELEKNNKLLAVTKITISTKQGDKITEMQKSQEGTFKYTFLKNELIVLKELSNYDDIALKINNFKNEDKSEIKVKKQIYFDLAIADLNENAKRELDEIAKILLENTTLNLEIIAHTDSRGDDVTNLTLSEKRAANSVNYLIAKGIKKERLKSKGMGETDILNQCKNGINCIEAEHAVNRRTEFVFIKQ